MKELFADANMGLIGLIFFFLFFCAVLVWVMRPGSKEQYKNNSEIPLKEDE
ncbi:MAG: CcoQ/FixQ family Cbb3-type cytochrome c oxidase assembly chaperone [Micavibrio sp.]|nr:CcoQ/FixQ family Cbb3-type cytochrome c oxidase assembly chaperone [Micavibrio sp.]|tara:strand:+ start:961 stop:1113 length:153 start_codon:yes stop_codon:yes gene_type:complete